MQLNKIKQITILSTTFDIVYNDKDGGGIFDWTNSKITIVTIDLKKDPLYVISVVSHELMEGILIMMGGRYQNPRDQSYLFNYDHKMFESAIDIHFVALSKFIKA